MACVSNNWIFHCFREVNDQRGYHDNEPVQILDTLLLKSCNLKKNHEVTFNHFGSLCLGALPVFDGVR